MTYFINLDCIFLACNAYTYRKQEAQFPLPVLTRRSWDQPTQGNNLRPHLWMALWASPTPTRGTSSHVTALPRVALRVMVKGSLSGGRTAAGHWFSMLSGLRGAWRSGPMQFTAKQTDGRQEGKESGEVSHQVRGWGMWTWGISGDTERRCVMSVWKLPIIR